MTDQQKAILVGAECGLVFAAVAALLCWLGHEGNVTLRELSDIMGSVPTLLAQRLGLRGFNCTVLCFIHWVIIGGILGFFIGLKRPLPAIAAIIMVVVLLVFHQLAHGQLDRAKQAMELGAFSNSLIGD